MIKMNVFKKSLKIFFYNFTVLLFLIVILEIIFGYWFKRNNFGIYMRAERNKVVNISVNHHNNEKIDFVYKRNFYGFVGDEFDPKNVKIIFEGGSTGVEMWKPPKTSIVEVINKLLKKDGENKKIYNSSINGKSIRGYVYDFKHWFTKIPNFKPDYVIFYLGINDRKYINNEIVRFFDEQHSNEKSKMIRDYIKNNSFILEKIKKIQNKYFAKNYSQYDMNKKDLYKNFKYTNYEKALLLHSPTLTGEEKKHLSILKDRLEELKTIIERDKFIPIFITQIKFDGLSDRRLFLVNEEIKKFTRKNNFKIIPIDELIKDMLPGDFYDEVHTTISGSDKIAQIIYKNLIW